MSSGLLTLIFDTNEIQIQIKLILKASIIKCTNSCNTCNTNTCKQTSCLRRKQMEVHEMGKVPLVFSCDNTDDF